LYPLSGWQSRAVSGGLVILLVILLYRASRRLGKFRAAVGGRGGDDGMAHLGRLEPLQREDRFRFSAGAFNLSWVWFAALGSAMVKTVYSYWATTIFACSAERFASRRKYSSRHFSVDRWNRPAVSADADQHSRRSAVREAQNSPFVASLVIERLYGHAAARFMTWMVLWIAMASVFSLLLGYSRVPYSAALDGNFFPIFGKLHPTKKFPYVSLLVLGGIAFVFSVSLKLETAIAGILAMRLLVQFIGQAVGVMLLRRQWGTQRLPFKMWLYPVPAVITIIGCAALFWATGPARKWGIVEIALGVVAFLVRAHQLKEWPFALAKPAVEGATS